MQLRLIEHAGVCAIEGEPGERFMVKADDAARVIEVCLSKRADGALLYAANLPAEFFDLSSGQAGDVLQKFRNYRLRLAVVCASGEARMSSRFGEMVAEERRGRQFGVFPSRDEALSWLADQQP